MFLHFGWLHLLGNLLFFYLTGPLLEDLWGRRFFLGFYLLGGLVAGAAQVAMEHRSGTSIAGASGAIAACMGAFSHRFAGRRVRMGYLTFLLFRFGRGTFLVPAWLWGLVWFGGQLLGLALGSSGGVAVFAHVAGFAFGFFFAMLLPVTGFEENTLRPAIEAGTVFHAKNLARPDLERVRSRRESGHQRTIPLARLAGVGSATLPLAADGTFLVITDLVLRFADASGPTRVIRIPGTKLGLTALFPALAPQVAYRELLGRLLAHTQLSALPDRASLEEGRLPAFDSSAQLDAAFYPEQLAKP